MEAARNTSIRAVTCRTHFVVEFEDSKVWLQCAVIHSDRCDPDFQVLS